MKNAILTSLRLTVALLILLAIAYPLLITFIGKLVPGNGLGNKIEVNGRPVGYEVIGQKFDHTAYFWGRPSAVDYNASASGGSNKGPSNSAYLHEVQNRIDKLLKDHPGLMKADISVDLLTASGSGLDPHISPQAARIQVARVAQARKISERQVTMLVQKHTEKPLWGLFGPSKVNVLKLNVELDQITPVSP